jgi:Uma2 family endonuclease
MSPAPDLVHQRFVGEIFFQLRAALAESPCQPFVAPVDVRLPKGDESDGAVDTVVQPDVFVVCDPARLDRRGVRGAPEFAVEVLSPATAGHDHVAKRHVYQRAGVREYWLVHPVDRIVTIYRREGSGYAPPVVQELAGTTAVEALPGVVIDWNEISARIPQTD